jgi:ribose 5-phosphate isomerase A
MYNLVILVKKSNKGLNILSIEQMKRNAAKMALKYIQDDQVIGVGTGSTVNFLIEELATIKHKIAGAVSSSVDTTKRLQALQIPVADFNAVDDLPIYIDGADAYNELKQLVKGGGGALTREKILAYSSKQFICIVDASKRPSILGKFPVAIEVIPMARSYVARQLIKLGGKPEYRHDFTTDNGNIILDVFGWDIMQPIELESKLNQIPGVVCNGIFAVRPADVIIVGEENV